MVYLPTFGCFLGQMLVNIPYMEHMGIDSIAVFDCRRLSPKRGGRTHPPKKCHLNCSLKSENDDSTGHDLKWAPVF